VLLNRLQQPVMRRLPGSRYTLVCVFRHKHFALVQIEFALVRGRFGHPVFPTPQLGHNRLVPFVFDLSLSSPISWQVRPSVEDFDSVAHFESQRCLLRCIPLCCRSGRSLREALLHDSTAQGPPPPRGSFDAEAAKKQNISCKSHESCRDTILLSQDFFPSELPNAQDFFPALLPNVLKLVN